MSPLPTEFRDRWKNRPEPAPGFGTVYWHVLMSRYGGARSAARDARAVLSQFGGFHPTPSEWLHMTTLLVGPAEQYQRSQLRDMIATASHALAETAAIQVQMSRVLYHPEAVMLAVDPVQSLCPLREAAEVASGIQHSYSEATQPWVPHMTIAYSVANQSTEAIISRLGVEVEPHQAAIDRLTLVIQWGPERAWKWEPVGEVLLSRTVV